MCVCVCVCVSIHRYVLCDVVVTIPGVDYIVLCTSEQTTTQCTHCCSQLVHDCRAICWVSRLLATSMLSLHVGCVIEACRHSLTLECALNVPQSTLCQISLQCGVAMVMSLTPPPACRYREKGHVNARAAATDKRSYSEQDPRPSATPPLSQGQDNDVFDKVVRGVEDETFDQVEEEILEQYEYEEEEEEEGEPDRGDMANTDENLPRTTATTANQPSPLPTSQNQLPPVKANAPYHVAALIGEDHALSMSYCLHSTWGSAKEVSLFTTSPVEPMHLPKGVSVRQVTSHPSAWLLGLLSDVVPTLQDDVQWLVLVPGTVYVHLPALEEVLQGMDPQEDVYMGYGQAHCSFKYGVILSRSVFTKLYRDLGLCARKFAATEDDHEGDSVLVQCALEYGVKCSDGEKVGLVWCVVCGVWCVCVCVYPLLNSVPYHCTQYHTSPYPL